MDDKIENQIKEVDSIKKPSVYFSVSLFKFTIMYFGTFGLYGFYAVEDRTPRVYPWMNEPGGGILVG